MTLIGATLSRYFARQFLGGLLVVLGGLLGIILLFELVELLRRAEPYPDVTAWLVLRMGLLKLPETGQRALPFAILFAAQFLFWRMTRTNEMVVARALGASAWRFLLPVVAVAVGLAFLKLLLINPIAAVMISRFEQLENQYLHGKSSAINVSSAGLWLRQPNAEGGVVTLYARSLRPNDAAFETVTVFFESATGTFEGRLDAEYAYLEAGHWRLHNIWVNQPQQPVKRLDSYLLPTEMTLGNIEESLASPETLPFWSLPSFIETLKATGLSTRRHEIFFQSQLASPVLFAAMVLFAAAFANRLARSGGTLKMISAGLATGLGLFVVNDVVLALGQSMALPVLVAAWFPASIALLSALGLLLYLEDG